MSNPVLASLALVGEFKKYFKIYEDIHEVLYVFNVLDDSWSKPIMNVFTAVKYCHELNSIFTHIEVTA